MKKFLKESKGLGATDGLIAVLIIALFTGLIATLLYNIYIANTSLKRMSTANSYVVDILEYTDQLYYDNLTFESYSSKYSFLQNKTGNELGTAGENLKRLLHFNGNPTEQGEKGYNIDIVIDRYTPSQESIDIIKQITVTVSYKVGNRQQKIEISRIKVRETLLSPNKPDLNLVELEEGESRSIRKSKRK